MSTPTPSHMVSDKKDNMQYLYYFAGVIAAIGAINWLLVSQGFNLVENITGKGTEATNVVYMVVGICGFISLVSHYLWISSPKFGMKHHNH